MRRIYGYTWREFWLYSSLGEIQAMLKAITPEEDESGAADEDAITAMGF